VRPKIVCRNRLDGNFDHARGIKFVRVRVLANEQSGRADLDAIVARAHVVQAGYSIGGARSDLGEGELRSIADRETWQNPGPQ
jgi:hypothetical protein